MSAELIATIITIVGVIISQSALWYRIGKIENMLKEFNGDRNCKNYKPKR